MQQLSIKAILLVQPGLFHACLLENTISFTDQLNYRHIMKITFT